MPPAARSAARRADESRRSGAESSRKLLRLLVSFDEQHHTQTVSELAKRADIPVSSAYRFLSVLRDEKLVEEAERGSYRLSLRMVALGRAATAAVSNLLRAARPVLEQIAASSGETTLLIRRSGFSAVCSDRVESLHPVRLQFDPGTPMSLHAGSAARILLAALPRTERYAYYAQIGLPRPGHLGDAELDALARVGWAESFEEVDAGIWGVSALVTAESASMNGSSSDTVAAIGVAGPLFRLDADRRAEVIEMVRDGARTVSMNLRRQRVCEAAS